MISLLNRLFSSKPVQSAAAKSLRRAEKPSSQNAVKATYVNAINQADHSRGREARLVMVTKQNNNKYYHMTERSNGSFVAEYGRVGSLPMTAEYPMAAWDRVLKGKIRKGYVNTTELFAGVAKKRDFLPLNSGVAQELLDNLQTYAKQSISLNYNVSAEQVSLQQINEAQSLLDELSKQVSLKMDVESFNDELLRLYTIIPRRMTKVKTHLINRPENEEDLRKIDDQLAEEQATLDVMRGQVEINGQEHKSNTPRQTILEALNLSVEPLEDPSLIDLVKKMMGKQAKHFHRAFKVVNHHTQAKFDQFIEQQNHKQTALFWHGSRNENWLSIIKSGLVLRPANAVINGKMFGYGLYFADRCAKSLNYSSLRGSYWTSGHQSKGYLALYDVHIGVPLKIKRHTSWCTQLSTDALTKKGDYDSVFAKGGYDLRNNEYIVYRSEQCTVRYLIEIR